MITSDLGSRFLILGSIIPKSINQAQKKVNEKKDELWAASNAICDATAEYCVDRRDTTSECDRKLFCLSCLLVRDS